MPRTLCTQTLPDGRDNPAWLQARREGVTATDTAKLLTGGSWMELWAKKTGRLESPDIGHLERVQWGRWMEPIILQAYASERYANRTVKPSGELMQSDEHPWMLATLDARTAHPEAGWIPLDAKNTDKFLEYKWEHGPPAPFEWQCKHQAVVENKDMASIGCALGGNRLMWADIPVTEFDRKRIVEVTERFWWHVSADVPPTAENMDGSDATRRALNATFYINPDTELPLEGQEWDDIDEEYAHLELAIKTFKSATLKPMETRLQELQAYIKRRLGNHSHGMLRDGTMYIQTRINVAPYTVAPEPYNKLRRKAVRR